MNKFCRILYVVTLVCFAGALPISAAQAGFEWVPPQKGQPAPPPATPELETIPLEPLPLSEDKDMAMPQTSPAPRNLEPVQLLSTQPVTPAPAPMPASNAPQSLMPDSKIKVIEPMKQADREPISTVTPPQQPVMQVMEQKSPPAAPELKTKIIMSDDAPETALQMTPNSKRLTINPFPDVNQMPKTKTAAAPAPADDIMIPRYEPGAGKMQDITAPAPAAEEPMMQKMAAQRQPAPASKPQEQIIMHEVIGFGTDIPLALALRQVVPGNFSFSFAENVDPGQRVSWNGGKPWEEVLSDMVTPVYLEAVIGDRIVHIKKSYKRMTEAPTDSTMQVTETANHQDAEEVTATRSNITDPGTAEDQQTPETMDKIQEIAGTQEDEGQKKNPGDGASTDDRDVPVLKPEKPIENPPISISKIRFWEARQGTSLKETLEIWSKKANTTLVWNASGDYILKSNILVNDTFQNAVKTVFSTVLEDPNGPSLQLISEAGTDQPSKLIIDDLG